MHFLGIDWVGVNAENGRKLVLSLIFIAVLLIGGALLRGLVRLVYRHTGRAGVQTKFWTRQAINLVIAVILILGLLSIWFNDPTRLATAFGLMSAGLAFALQQVVTSLAGYFVILRGSTFTVGDRISMGVCVATCSVSASSKRQSWKWANRLASKAPTPPYG